MKKKKIAKLTAAPAEPAPGLWPRALELAQSPACAVITGLFVLACVFFATAYPLEDLDIWWHLRTGKYICQTGVIPRADIFSYVIHGKPWVTFEWLSQALFYKVWEAFGPLGIFAWRELMAALLFGALFLSGAGVPLAAGAILLFGLSFAGPGILERPQLFTYLFALLFRLLAEIFPARPRLAAAAVIGLAVLWANLHGGASVVGPLILAAVAAGRFLGGERAAARRLLVLAAAAAAAALVNPHFYRIYTHLFATWFEPAQKWVLEWQPLSTSDPQFPFYAAYLLVLAAAAFLLPAPKKFAALLLAGLFGAYFGFRSARNVPLAFFVTAPDLLAAAKIFFRERKKTAALLLPLLAAWIVYGYTVPLKMVRPGPVSPDPIAREWLSGACDFIAGHGLTGRMYNDYVIGGYLIWRLAPERQVFVDGRSLEYGALIMHRIAGISMREGFKDLDGEYKFDYLVFQQRKDSRLLYLDDDPDWRCLYFDDGGLVYAHRRRADAALAERLGFRYLRPNEQSFGYLDAYAGEPRAAAAVLKELDRAIAQAPARLAANAYLMKSYFLLAKNGPEAWARWVRAAGDRFDYPQWHAQYREAARILAETNRAMKPNGRAARI